MKILNRFWSEQEGFLISLEMILAAILLVIGMVAAMQVLRDAVSEELGDLGMAIGAIDNSYTVAGITAPANGGGTQSTVAGWQYIDAADDNDVAAGTQTASALLSTTNSGLIMGKAPTQEQ